MMTSMLKMTTMMTMVLDGDGGKCNANDAMKVITDHNACDHEDDVDVKDDGADDSYDTDENRDGVTMVMMMVLMIR